MLNSFLVNDIKIVIELFTIKHSKLQKDALTVEDWEVLLEI
jgi:hypothetical protein